LRSKQPAGNEEDVMKVKYIGETKDIKTVSGKDARLSKDMELECMEKEYHSAMTVRATLASGEHVKIGRKELQKIDVC
jgi:hypothetical protein